MLKFGVNTAMRTRTTVAIDDRLLKAVDSAVKAGNARSRNDFLSRALRRELKLTRCQAIDQTFAGMASDQVFQRGALEISEEYAAADWDALELGEGLS